MFCYDLEKQDLLPCVLFHVTGGDAGAIDSGGPAGPRRVFVEIWAISRNKAECHDIIENVMADSPIGLHGASWVEDNTRINLARVAEFMPDDKLETPINAFVCGCATEMSYSQVS